MSNFINSIVEKWRKFLHGGAAVAGLDTYGLSLENSYNNLQEGTIFKTKILTILNYG